MVCCLVRTASRDARGASSPSVPGALEAVARACSPRVAPCGDDVVVFDASGLARVLGPPADIAREVVALAQSRGIVVNVAIASTLTSAWLLAHACTGTTIVKAGEEAAALAPLPLSWLAIVADLQTASLTGDAGPDAGDARVTPLRGGRSRRTSGRHYRMAPGPQIVRQPQPVAAPSRAGTVDAIPLDVLALFERWGLRTLGDVARLSRADLRTRLGTLGARLHQAACGEDSDPMVPAGERLRFRERRELEWPIDGLEPLSFVLSGACEALEHALERADRGAVTVITTLHLVTKTRHERTLHLPAPMRDARVLRTLIVLDLESHPPDAGIDVVEVEVLVAPGRITQGGLFTPTIPSPEDLSTLLARLGALLGTRRVGAPVVVDSHDEREFAMAAFNPHQAEMAKRPRASAVGSADGVRQQATAKAIHRIEAGASEVTTAHRDASVSFRRFRLPIAARVTVERGAPIRVQPSARGLPGGVVTSSAGPWRSSGRWWSLDGAQWDRDEWDVEIAASGIYRLTRSRASGQWEIEGMVD
ncbi:MAG TPA: hypothetical protein VFO19_10815 [Vicinamibacterales bacterium]|nr:hypothetical protein [Vicinamibacterales bacterium]